MILFSRQRPREFHHEYIYADERKRRLKELEQRARRELGLDQRDGHAPRFNVSIRPGKHVGRRKSRKSQGVWNMNILILSFIVILLVIVCRLLLGL